MSAQIDSRTSELLVARAAIRQVLENQMAAWNQGDLESYMAACWQSHQFSLTSGGETFRGWQVVLDRYRQHYQQEKREMGRLTLGDLDVEMLGPESGFVRGRWQVALSRQALGGLFTLVFHKLPEGWRIVHVHTSS
jgi:beta-aspartyl-peptidase (threonine type)